MARFPAAYVYGTALASLLTGCGSGTPASLAPPSQSALATRPAAHSARPFTGRSWILPGAKSTALVYVADDGASTVSIYSDPAWQPLGALLGFNEPWHLCLDAAQDVYVVDLGTKLITEYAHGSVAPVQTFDDSQGEPIACAVNPVTGDLAVADVNGPNDAPGDVVVYHSAKRSPRKYTVPGFYNYFRVAYDPSGNLIAEGSDKFIYQSYLAELPNGGRAFEPLTLDQNIAWGDLAWDGRFMTVAYSQGESTFIYRLKISGSNVTVKDSTFLSNAELNSTFFEESNSKTPHAIGVVGTNGEAGTVGEWDYPAGGAPNVTISGFDYPDGVVVSQ